MPAEHCQWVRILRLSFLLFLISMLIAPVSFASTRVNVLSSRSAYVSPFQAWTDRPYTALPTPDADVDLYLAVCPGASIAAGCTVPTGFWGKSRPTMWINPVVLDPQDPDMTRYVYFHELGHVFDYVHLDDVERARIIEMFGFPSTMPWYGNSSARPNELFAEGASNCWYGPNIPGRAYGFPYSYEEAQPLCRALAGAYRNDNRWFGQKIIAAKRRSLKITTKNVLRGPAIKWGGYEVSIRTFNSQMRDLFTCSGTARFAAGTVKYDLCGRNLKISSTLTKPFFITFWDIPKA